MSVSFGWIPTVAIILLVVVTVARSIRRIPQENAGIVERLGRYHRTLVPGLHVLMPFIDQLRPLVDLREQTLSVPSQTITTADDRVVSVGAVVRFQVADARAAAYGASDYVEAVEMLTTTAARDIIGGLSREDVLTRRGDITRQLSVALERATGRLGVRFGRVEIIFGR